MEALVPGGDHVGFVDGARTVAAVEASDAVAFDEGDSGNFLCGIADDVGGAVGAAAILPEPEASVEIGATRKAEGGEGGQDEKVAVHGSRNASKGPKVPAWRCYRKLFIRRSESRNLRTESAFVRFGRLVHLHHS